VKTEYMGWDYIKYLIAMTCDRAYILPGCGDYDKRNMVVAFLPDYNGEYSTIIITLSGSPVRGYAIIDAHPFNLKRDDIITVNSILVCGISLKPCRRYGRFSQINFEKHGIDRLSIRELLSRKDVVVVNNQLKQ